MSEYLELNKNYWEKGYAAPNVDHNAFRFAGRILRPDFGLPRNRERLLDFGCGQGAAVKYFNGLGFTAHGTDFSVNDIAAARSAYPDLAKNFFLCDGQPSANPSYGDGEAYRVICAIQSLYYFTKSDFSDVVQRLYDQLEPGGVFYATMMGTESRQFFDNSSPTEDPWLRRVEFADSRHTVSDYTCFLWTGRKI
jgi:cyclopropane fatty-acyl-phospholipid synthase-like methyltransferase